MTDHGLRIGQSRMQNEVFEQYSDIIPDFADFKESLLRPLPIHFRVNRLKTEPEPLICTLRQRGIEIQKVHAMYDLFFHMTDVKSLGNLLEYFLGYIHPQALTSCLATIVLTPGPNSYVLDMCASPGGKTSHLAQLMNNTGLIIANELYPARHIPLAHTLSRLGVLNTVLTGYQAQEFPRTQRFEYILADVPCSGEGRVRFANNGPTLKHKKIHGRSRLLEMQKRIILRGYDLLKDSGEMLYSTCTYNPEENESIVHYLLENRDGELLPIDVGMHHEPGITRWRNRQYDKQIEQSARFYPHQIDSVGFFMARIGKKR
jgi:NOL1/NOP2/sun family putative RNA methylase